MSEGPAASGSILINAVVFGNRITPRSQISEMCWAGWLRPEPDLLASLGIVRKGTGEFRDGENIDFLRCYRWRRMLSGPFQS